MYQKLGQIEKRYNELSHLMSQPEVIANQNEFRRLAKELAEISGITKTYQSYKRTLQELKDTQEILASETDRELLEMAQSELKNLEQRKDQAEQELKILLVPKDPSDEKNVIVEIRAGTGGEEAALFVADLFRMYSRYAERNHWKMEVLSENPTGIGGYKEIIANVQGQGAYSRFKFESGTHRVQRVPETETSGRIHTSAVTVAILPEAEEVDVEIDPADLRIDVFRASGAGGQHVNRTDSAVRLTHIPTEIVISMQDDKSQHKNKAKAMKILRARLQSRYEEEQKSKRSQNRKSQVGSGDRSERIRTYNFPQGRITDHRIGLTLYQLDAILDGSIHEMIEKLTVARQLELLQNFGLGESSGEKQKKSETVSR